MRPLDVLQVEYSYTGCQSDLIFVIGARTLEDLGQLYSDEKSCLKIKRKLWLISLLWIKTANLAR